MPTKIASQAQGRPPKGGPVPHTVDPASVPDAPLVSPYGSGGLHDVARRTYLLKLLVQKEIQARYNGSFLGLLWSYVLPLVRFCMYFFVIGLVLGLHKDVPNFAIHMFCALVFVHFFTETFSSGTRSIMRNKAIVRKMAMPREMFPVSAVIVSLIHTFPQVLILLVAAFTLGWDPSATDLGAGLLGFTVLTLFCTGLALVFSAFNVYFRDFGQFVSLLTIFTHWAVPMIYPYSKVATSSLAGSIWQDLYLANPLTEAVLLLQKCFWVPTCDGPNAAKCTGPDAMPPDLFERGFIMLGIGVVFLLVCQRVFTRLEGKFAERL
jgi:ABC-2 type transport system permease protein